MSRAWRLGAQGPVEVETILAKDSVEESMKAFEAGLLNDSQVFQKEEGMSLLGKKDHQERKTHYLLKSLRFITDYHQFRKNPQKRPPPMQSMSEPLEFKRRKVTFAIQ